MRRRVSVGVLVLGMATGRLGAGGTIVDQAASLEYPTLHWSSVAPANLLGAYASPTSDPLRASGFWYRVVGLDTREHPLPVPDSEHYEGKGLIAEWSDLDGKGLRVQEVTYVYDNERPSASFTSRLRLMNLGPVPKEVEVFHYLDVDVLGSGDDDKATSLTSHYLRFTDLGGSVIRYRADTSSAFQIAPYPTLRNGLNDSSVTNLSNDGVPFGPGDATAAYQFRVLLSNPGEWRDVGEVSVSVRAPHDYVKGELRSVAGYTGYPSLMFRRLSVPNEYYLRSMLRTNSWGRFGPLTTPLNQRIVGMDDFSGDHETDFVRYDSTTGLVQVGNSAVVGVLPVAQPWLWNIEATGDFDYDGKPDIVWRNSATRKIVIWRMNYNAWLGDIVPVPDQATDVNWAIKAALDFNGDGLRDLLWYNSTSGRAVIWHMDGAVHRIDGSFTDPSSAGDSNWQIVAAGDYGKGPVVIGAPTPVFGAPDIVWRNETSGKLVVWHMNFSGQRTAGVFTASETNPLDYEVVGPR